MDIEKYSSITSLMNSITLRLGYTGHAVVDSSWRTDRLATPFNRLYLIEHGSGVLYTDTQESPLEPGNAYLLPADLPCSYHCDGKLSLLFFHFSLAPTDRTDLMHGITILPTTPFSADQFRNLRQLCQNPCYENAFAATCDINNILLQMHQKYHFRWDNAPVYSPCIDTAICYIQQNLSSQLRVEQIAQACFVSGSYLSRQFHKETGVSVKQYVGMQLVNKAQWLLSNTAASIEHISGDLGFCNQFYFCEFFKKHCRVSPLQYRNGTKY